MQKLPKGITQAMVDAHRALFPPPKPLYAEIDVTIEETIAITARIRQSSIEKLRSLMPECNDEELILEIVDDFLIRMGAL